jgi:hypothetical protein
LLGALTEASGGLELAGLELAGEEELEELEELLEELLELELLEELLELELLELELEELLEPRSSLQSVSDGSGGEQEATDIFSIYSRGTGFARL